MARTNIEKEGISFEFAGDTAKFDDSINGINRSLNILKKEFKLFEKELKLDPGNVDTLTEEMKNLTQQAELARHAFELYDRSRKALKDEDGNWIVTKNTPQELEKVQKAWESYTKGMEDAQMTLLRYNERMEYVEKQIDEVNSGLFAQKKALEDSRNSFDHYTRGLDNNLTALDKEFKELKEEIKEQPDNVELLAKAYHNLNEQSAETAKYIGAVKDRMSKMTDKDGKVIEGYEKEYDELGKKAIIAEHNLETFQRRHEEVGKKIEEVTSDLYKQNKALEESAKKWDLAGNAFKDIGNSVEAVGRGLRPLSAGAIAGLGGAAKAAMDFESALTGVYKTVDETPTTSYEDIETWIRSMATELPSTAAEIANVAEVAGQLGITADALQPFVRTMIDLGNATNVTATDGAAALAQFFNIMGYSSEDVRDDVDNFGSALTALGNNAATDEESIVYMAKALAAAGHQIGLSSQEVLGLSTTLSSLGLSAERGGSAMSTIFRKIETDSKTYGAKVEERLAAWGELVGMTGQEFRNAWNTDTIGTIEKVIIGLGKTEDLSKSLYQVLQDVDISNIRQIDTITRLANSEGMLSEYIAMANEEWEKNTALTTEAERRYQTTESQMKMLWNRISELGITLGETLLPIINDLIDEIEPYIDDMIDLAETHGKAIVKTLAFAAALSPVVSGLGKTLKGVGEVSLAVSKYTKMAANSTGVTRNVALALANAGKFGLAGAAVLAGTALVGLAGYYIYTNRETVKYKKTLDQLSDSLANNIERSQEDYLVEQKRIEGAGYYAQKLSDLSGELNNLAGDEQRSAEIKQQMADTVNKLNAELGSQVYSFDETTGAISRAGQEVQNLTEDYAALSEEMKKNAWIDANRGAYEESISSQYKYMEQLQDAAARYSEKIANIDYNGIKAGSEFVSAAQQYLNGEITDIEVLADILRNNNDMMAVIDTMGGDALSATRTLLGQMQGYQRDYQTEIGLTTEKLQESINFQTMYNDILSAEPGQLDAILAKYNALALELGNDVVQLTTMKDAMIAARDAVAQTGADTSVYDTAIAAIDEQIGKAQQLTQTEVEGATQSAEAQKTKTDEANAYVEQANTNMNNTIADANKRVWDETSMVAKTDIDAVRGYIDTAGNNISPWIIDLIGRPDDTISTIISGGTIGKYSGSGGYGNGTRSGGFASSGYNITFSPTFNVSGGLSGDNAKRFALQMVDFMNEELGKRLRLNG